MPTYQYACTACDERLEAVQSFSDAPLTECPVCGGALRKVFSAVGVVFKGSGFYKTDSRAKTGSSNGAQAGKADAKGESKGDTAAAGPKDTPATSQPSSTPSTAAPASSTPATKSA